MNNAIYKFAKPANEPVKSYAPGSLEKEELLKALSEITSTQYDIPIIIGGKEIRTGNTAPITMPHDHKNKLGVYHIATETEIKMAIDCAVKAQKEWAAMPWVERATIMMRAAELIATKYRYVMNASVMAGQSKNAYQAEIDGVCELIDFLRFNVHFAGEIYTDQPISDTGVINRTEYRPLEGFVFTVSPFNFTAIAGNLNLAPVLMGNVTVWKPSSTSILSNYLVMKIFQEAGVPDGVINFVPSKGSEVGKIIFASPDFAGVHFTGSTAVFNSFWKSIGDNIANYKTYPRIVGETGGKDYILAHPSASARELAVAIVRGAFEYQGQKCSAASRAYIPSSLWGEVKEHIAQMLSEIKMGDVKDFTNFVNAVIDESSFDNIVSYIEDAKADGDCEITFGGGYDKSVGYFVEPTIITTKNPKSKSMVEEIFGPVITVYVYEDADFEDVIVLCDTSTQYALTGSIFCNDRYVLSQACKKLSQSAGNFYINDKPTGAVVGQQPFGGARASGTNDKAGSYLNLLRWTSPQSIKETLVSPVDYSYPFHK